MNYAEVFGRLVFETAIVIFMKKDGTIRTMLATRNLQTVALVYGFQGNVLGGHDNRCNIGNGNVAVFDMIAGDARSFNIDRLISIEYFGELKTREEYDEALKKFVDFKNKYESKMITMDMIE